MPSKAQGLSLNAMVLAGIGLLVLAVLIALFTGSFGGFGTELEGRSTQQCTDGVSGFKQMPGSCGVEGQYRYTQYFGNFEEGSIADGKICCKSECEAANGQCKVAGSSLSSNRIPKGDSGCPSGKLCYS